VLLELGKLLAAGDPLSHGWHSSRAREWHHLPGLDVGANKGGIGCSSNACEQQQQQQQQEQQCDDARDATCPMDVDPVPADTERLEAAAGASSSSSAAAGGALVPDPGVVGAADVAPTAALGSVDSEQQQQQQAGGIVLRRRQGQLACR
jgi:hypothetical protein